MADMKSCEEWKPFIAMIAVDFAFAVVNIVLKKILDEGMDHLVFVTYRLTISTIFLAPIGYFLERNSRPKLTPRILCYLFFSAIVGLETVDIKCNSGRAKVLGTVVCIGGAILLTLYRGVPLFDHSHSQAVTQMMDHAIKLNSTKKTERWTLGSIALVVGTFFWSSWFLLQSTIGKRYPCQYSSTAIMSFFGAIQSAILSFSTNRNLSAWALNGKIEIMTVLYAGIIGSGMCYVVMSWCVKKRGPVFTAAFSPLVQIMAAMFDIPILHEKLYLGSILGSIIVIIGMYILLWGKNKEMKVCLTKLAQEAEGIKEQEPQLQVVAISCDSRHHSGQDA
ncbi:wat1-related protein [Quercus suber]|uniref:WAT1-related protein n=1 Tax=Quercus suber TaxID=58331 RepID=A0AAW0K5U2_QUESU